MPMELTPLRKKLALVKTRVGSLDVHTGSLAGRPIVAVVTGMGTELATVGLERLLGVVVHSDTGAEYRPDRIGPGVPEGRMWTTDQLIVDLDDIARLRSGGV